jgi:hypothetical protein
MRTLRIPCNSPGIGGVHGKFLSPAIVKTDPEAGATFIVAVVGKTTSKGLPVAELTVNVVPDVAGCTPTTFPVERVTLGRLET